MAGVPVVCGTTGWEPQRAAAEDAVRAADGALFWSPNFSIGVQIFARVVERAAAEMSAFGSGFGAQMVETHHAAKKDAPSGTARMVADRAAKVLGREMPITSVRTGEVPGTHEVLFDAPFEHIRITHEARDRRLFAAGALTAANWLVGRKGVFGMNDLMETR